MDTIDKLLERLSKALGVVLALLLIAMIVLNFVNVVCRYGFGFSIQGADEVQVFGLVWLTFLGAVVVSWRNQHLRMDVVLVTLPSLVQRVVRLLETFCFMIVGTFIAVHSFSYTSRMFQLGSASDMAGVPTWIPHSAVVIGFALMVLVTAWRSAVGVYGAATRRDVDPTTLPERRGTQL